MRYYVEVQSKSTPLRWLVGSLRNVFEDLDTCHYWKTFALEIFLYIFFCMERLLNCRQLWFFDSCSFSYRWSCFSSSSMLRDVPFILCYVSLAHCLVTCSQHFESLVKGITSHPSKMVLQASRLKAVKAGNSEGEKNLARPLVYWPNHRNSSWNGWHQEG